MLAGLPPFSLAPLFPALVLSLVLERPALRSRGAMVSVSAAVGEGILVDEDGMSVGERYLASGAQWVDSYVAKLSSVN